MMTITDVYRKYKIINNLQDHQLRVAAVAKAVINDIQKDVKEDDILRACLLHDMGNIIKFDLSRFPQFLEPEGEEYWQKVKDEYTTKYGHNEHHASMVIARELGVNEYALKLIDQISFSKETENVSTTDFNIKICAYADMRVGPHGILSLEDRLADGRERYKNNKSFDILNSQIQKDALGEIERQIFSKCSIKPETITDAYITKLLEELKSYAI